MLVDCIFVLTEHVTKHVNHYHKILLPQLIHSCRAVIRYHTIKWLIILLANFNNFYDYSSIKYILILLIMYESRPVNSHAQELNRICTSYN